MVNQLDYDSLINIMEYLPLSDLIENFLLTNSRLYNLFQDDDQKSLRDLILNKILLSEEGNFIKILKELNQIILLDSLLLDDERKVIKYQKIIEMEDWRDLRGMDWDVIEMESYGQVKTCFDCCKRLLFVYLLRCEKNKRKSGEYFELLFDAAENGENITRFDDYANFMNIARQYELSSDRIYKFRLCYEDGQLKVLKLFSKPKLEKLNKEIFLKDDQDSYPSLIIFDYGQSHSLPLDVSVLVHQEMSEFKLIISTHALQSSNIYKSNYNGFLSSNKKNYMLYKANRLFHAVTKPYQCGDLRFSRINNIGIFTISRKDIKQMLFPYLVYSPPFFMLAIYILFNHVNWSFEKLNPFLSIFDFSIFIMISLGLVDHCVNYMGKAGKQEITLVGQILGIVMGLKISCSFFISLFTGDTTMKTFYSSFGFTIPFTFTTVPLIYGTTLYANALWRYIRSCDWFYNYVVHKSGHNESFLKRSLRNIAEWISGDTLKYDTLRRCRIDKLFKSTP